VTAVTNRITCLVEFLFAADRAVVSLTWGRDGYFAVCEFTDRLRTFRDFKP